MAFDEDDAIYRLAAVETSPLSADLLGHSHDMTFRFFLDFPAFIYRSAQKAAVPLLIAVTAMLDDNIHIESAWLPYYEVAAHASIYEKKK